MKEKAQFTLNELRLLYFYYPFTAPATIPFMICLLNTKYRTTIGAIVVSIADMIFG